MLTLDIPQRKLIKVLGTLLAVTIFLHLPTLTPPKAMHTQHHLKGRSLAQPTRQDAVKREFLHAWVGYKDHTWMADGLMPLLGMRRRHQFCGWLATLVDALDTLYIMDLKDDFQEAGNATLSIDFSQHVETCHVQLFESTIRHLGGLMAAYDLSQNPGHSLSSSSWVTYYIRLSIPPMGCLVHTVNYLGSRLRRATPS